MVQQRKSQKSKFNNTTTELPVIGGGSDLILDRHKVNLPALNGSFDPDFPDSSLWINRFRDFKKERGGLKANTIKMFASTLRVWDQFCAEQEVYSFPIEEEALCEWFYSLAAEGKRKSSLMQHKAQLSYLYKFVFACEKSPTDSIVIKQYLRTYISDQVELTGETIKDKQALPVRLKDLNAIKKAKDNPRNHTTVINERDYVFITIAYGLMLRFDEIRTLKRWQVDIKRRGKKSEVLVHRTTSKTSDSPLPKILKDDFATVLIQYIDENCDHLKRDDYIFSRLTIRHGLIRPERPISKQTVSDLFKRAFFLVNPKGLKHTDNTHAHWTGHSARVGGALDGYEMGMSIDDLMELGDWTSKDTLMRYLRNSKSKSSANEKLQRTLK